jgi:hypothetical protein
MMRDANELLNLLNEFCDLVDVVGIEWTSDTQQCVTPTECDWPDLGSFYFKACKVLGREAVAVDGESVEFGEGDS